MLWGPLCAIAAIIALWASWHVHPVRGVAWALIGAVIASNILQHVAPFVAIPLLDPILEAWAGMAAASAWLILRDRHAFAVIGLAALITLCGIAYNLIITPAWPHEWLYVTVTNCLFIAQCFCVTLWGRGYAVAGGDRRRIGPAATHPAPDIHMLFP